MGELTLAYKTRKYIRHLLAGTLQCPHAPLGG